MRLRPTVYVPRPTPRTPPPAPPVPPKAPTCPECGAKLASQSGCKTCLRCGWAKCG